MRVKELAERAALSPDIEQRLQQKLLQMEHRTYLWLHLAIDDIQTVFENSLRPAEEEIAMIPQSVDKVYEKVLSRVSTGQLEIARKILQIIVAARRPLTTTEMAIALGIATSPQARTAGKARLEPSHIDKKLRRLCGLFVFVNNSKVYLIHQTAREFLLKKSDAVSFDYLYSWTLTDTENQMASICLRYLLMQDLEQDDKDLCSEIRSFLDYSALYWPDHTRKMSLTQDQEVASQGDPLRSTITVISRALLTSHYHSVKMDTTIRIELAKEYRHNAKLREYSPKEEQIIREYVKKNLARGFIERSIRTRLGCCSYPRKTPTDCEYAVIIFR